NAPSIPQQTLTDLATALTAAVTTDATHEATGTVSWTASIADQDLDFLGQGETLTATYDVTVTDDNGGSATEPITGTCEGANDAPAIAGGTSSGPITDDLPVSLGANLIVNGGFEVGDVGWDAVGLAGAGSNPHSGGFAGLLQIVNNSMFGDISQSSLS